MEDVVISDGSFALAGLGSGELTVGIFSEFFFGDAFRISFGVFSESFFFPPTEDMRQRVSQYIHHPELLMSGCLSFCCSGLGSLSSKSSERKLRFFLGCLVSFAYLVRESVSISTSS